MGLILKQLFGFIKLLNSDTGTYSLALGISLGFILGLTPTLSLHALLIFILILFFRIQLGAALISAFFFKLIAYLLDPVMHSLGSWALKVDSLQSLYTTLYNMPIIPFTRFNNTIVMGALVLGLLSLPIVFFLSMYLIEKYRKTIVERFKDSKLFKAFKATALYKWYYKYDQLFG